MEADRRAEAGDGGWNNRQRRRRDRERHPVNNGSNHTVDGQEQYYGDYGSYQGRRGAGRGARTDYRVDNSRADFVNGVYRPEGQWQPENQWHQQGGGGYGRADSNGNTYEKYDKYESSYRGRGEGRRNRGGGYGGGQSYHQHAPPPPPQWPEQDEHNLKDLLLQVAPQARIVENASRLSSKASANILSRVLTEATNTSTSSDCNGTGNAISTDTHGTEDDDETAFMERWSGLFSKGSPLVDGSMQDPFQDVKKRTKVVWKKGNERRGHHTRYQQRKQQKEQALLENGGDEDEADAEAGASIVYDASWPQPWQPQRPPALDEVIEFQ